MDSTHPGLRHRPFPTTPDTNCYYPATSHETALFRLRKGLDENESIMILTGEPGTGKTLLSHCLLERLGEDRPSLVMTNSHVRDRASLYQALLYDLALPYEGRGEQEMRLALMDHLLVNFQQGRSTVVLIDEAQHLGSDLLEELRLLGNLEARTGRAVQVVLIGQPRLLHTLRRPELRALCQRLTVRVELQPLKVEEAADYLLHHLRVVGRAVQEVFSEEALEMLAQATQGVPRLLNKAGQHALNLAHENGLATVDAEVVLEVLTALGLELPETEPAESPLLSTEDKLSFAAAEESVETGPNVLAFGAEDPTCQLFEAPRRPA